MCTNFTSGRIKQKKLKKKKKAQNLIFSFVVTMNPTNISANSFNIFQLNQDKLFILYCTKETGTSIHLKSLFFFFPHRTTEQKVTGH